jgi:hypothetical protein
VAVLLEYQVECSALVVAEMAEVGFAMRCPTGTLDQWREYRLRLDCLETNGEKIISQK